MTEIDLDEDTKMIEEHKKQIQELADGFKRKGEHQSIEYSTDQIQKLFESDLIPKDLAEWFFNNQKEQLKKRQEMEEFVKNNPEMPKDEIINKVFKVGQMLTPQETFKLYEDAAYSGRFFEFLFENRHLINGENKQTTTLYNNVDINENFGIAKFVSDSIYYLTKLLKEMEATHIHGSIYEAKGRTSNSKGEGIELLYTFPASSEEEADKILAEYKKTMTTKGLKIWMAHWFMANEAGKVEYTCPMIDIMKKMADEGRESFFSVKEKEEHWAITRMLGNSKLRRDRKTKKRGTGTEVVQWIEQPLLEILGGEKELEAQSKYPTLIAVRVLVPMHKSGFVPSIYKNETLKTNPSDSFLSFVLQNRATQRGRGEKDLRFDWEYLFELGNLQTTASTKKSMAKEQTRKKMDRLQKSGIIEKWDETMLGIDITPKKQKRKTNASSKKEST